MILLSSPSVGRRRHAERLRQFHPHFIPTFPRRVILPALPLSDDPRTCRARRKEDLSGLAVTCGKVPGGGGDQCGSVGGSALSCERPGSAGHRTDFGFHACSCRLRDLGYRTGPVAGLAPFAGDQIRAGNHAEHFRRRSPSGAGGPGQPGKSRVGRTTLKRVKRSGHCLSDADIIRR